MEVTDMSLWIVILTVLFAPGAMVSAAEGGESEGGNNTPPTSESQNVSGQTTPTPAPSPEVPEEIKKASETEPEKARTHASTSGVGAVMTGVRVVAAYLWHLTASAFDRAVILVLAVLLLGAIKSLAANCGLCV